MSATTTHKNTRRAALDMDEFSWEAFRFEDDGRKWSAVAVQRRAYAMIAAGKANPNGTSVTLGVNRFKKAAGKRSTAVTRLGELAEMGVLLPVLHIDRDGKERETLSKWGTKVRRLRYDPLLTAQAIIDAGQEFTGHIRLTLEQQREIQRAWMAETNPKGSQDSSESVPKGSQHTPKEANLWLTATVFLTEKQPRERPKPEHQPNLPLPLRLRRLKPHRLVMNQNWMSKWHLIGLWKKP